MRAIAIGLRTRTGQRVQRGMVEHARKRRSHAPSSSKIRAAKRMKEAFQDIGV